MAWYIMVVDTRKGLAESWQETHGSSQRGRAAKGVAARKRTRDTAVRPH